jgi:hypothetical protein
MKTCIIIDNPTSAIGLAARARFDPDSQVILSGSDYINPSMLVNAIRKCKPTTLFFTWRGALRIILEDRRSAKLFTQISRDLPIGMLIPDLLGLFPKNRKQEELLLNYVDFYLVTSHELLREYLNTFPQIPPMGLYRDYPDVKSIYEIRDSVKTEKSIDVIWVGNSRWGIHGGATDHKGLSDIVIPLKASFNQSLNFKIIDSSESRIPHTDVLKLIHNSRILLQTSKTEGTGLPLLEAAGLGTVVLTTKVGIAEYFLNHRLSELIIPRAIGDFDTAIRRCISDSANLSQLLMSRFDQYVKEIKSDVIPQNIKPKLKDSSSFIRSWRILSHLKWFRRWLLARVNTN